MLYVQHKQKKLSNRYKFSKNYLMQNGIIRFYFSLLYQQNIAQQIIRSFPIVNNLILLKKAFFIFLCQSTYLIIQKLYQNVGKHSLDIKSFVGKFFQKAAKPIFKEFTRQVIQKNVPKNYRENFDRFIGVPAKQAYQSYKSKKRQDRGYESQQEEGGYNQPSQSTYNEPYTEQYNTPSYESSYGPSYGQTYGSSYQPSYEPLDLPFDLPFTLPLNKSYNEPSEMPFDLSLFKDFNDQYSDHYNNDSF